MSFSNKFIKFKIIITLIIGCLFTFSLKSEETNVKIFANFEYGTSLISNHIIQFGENGSLFDLVKSGSQNILFPNWRVGAGINFLANHTVTLMYQPIFISTRAHLNRDWVLDTISMSKGQGVKIDYFFPFYRAYYRFDLLNKQGYKLGVGLGLQIRNASIVVENIETFKLFSTNSIGPVPLLGVHYDILLSKKSSFETNLIGFWAPIKYLNGGTTDVVGWIYEFDTAFNQEITKSFIAFINLRVIGGGNYGSSKKSRPSGGSYAKNIINIISLNIGLKAVKFF